MIQIKSEPYAIDLKVFSDDRGVFCPYIDGAYLAAVDARGQEKNITPIKRAYYVENHVSGTIRGFHFHKEEHKIFTVVTGAAKFITIDPALDDPLTTKREFFASVRCPRLVIVPPHYANGWMSLEDNTVLLCLSSSITQESIKDDRRYDPMTWGDVWTVKSR
jgi:dTDP-4-dehydrorhamnose 3,5-epimerase-like enzyme